MASAPNDGKILILATESCAYPGANSVGQAHSSYPANTYILRVRAPALFPEHFYMDCFRKGISGIIIMSCGEECPYEGAYHAMARRLERVYKQMKELEDTINAVDCDAVVIGTPIDLGRMLNINKPHTRVLYELEERQPGQLEAAIRKVLS